MTLGVIGHFGGGKNYCDGQTVKTLNLTNLLEQEMKLQVYRVDTHLNQTNKLSLLAKTLYCLLTCKHIFLLVAENGMKVYLPLLYYANKLFHRRIYHYIIGSEILALVKENPRLVKYLNAIRVNWFEYQSGTEELRQAGVANVETLHNFKYLTPVTAASKYVNYCNTFRFCTFSRVMEEKGITDAVEAIAKYNHEHAENKAVLDIYGPVESKYQETLDRLISEHRDCARYCGVAKSDGSVEVLSQYYALLFPTRWPGEGFPGTMIDAFASGIPVIATDWNANGELIENWKQGIIYPNSVTSGLLDSIAWSIEHQDEMNEMRANCRKQYDLYTPESVLRAIQDKMV